MLLKLTQVAERLNCSVTSVQYAIHRGYLKAIRVGLKKGYRVSEQEIERYMESRAVEVIDTSSLRAEKRDAKPLTLKHLTLPRKS